MVAGALEAPAPGLRGGRLEAARDGRRIRLAVEPALPVQGVVQRSLHVRGALLCAEVLLLLHVAPAVATAVTSSQCVVHSSQSLKSLGTSQVMVLLLSVSGLCTPVVLAWQHAGMLKSLTLPWLLLLRRCYYEDPWPTDK